MKTRRTVVSIAACLLAIGCAAEAEPPAAETSAAILATTPPVSCYHDADGDGRGHGALDVHVGSCSDVGWAYTGTDCDDGNARVWQNLDCYDDKDGDGYGVGTAARTCTGATCTDGAI